jgi:chromosome segregation protein
MRLDKIQVAGFKSFVDPTTIQIPGDLVGIVGPNGCGKSNVIDAVRWVMGESSARNLRGDNMADVIFNGAVSRKPVGKASVELIFDNSEGKGPGNYVSFSEISVKRTLSRDGTSEYLINNSRCRRRDITDMFRGTGLGHRSYSIIEQGMVSRIVEARPEELRTFVEEAAGISIYKDRRRETETRIRHTRENLDRIEDIRNELAAQLRKLQRQSQAARRYKRLKSEEQIVNGELLALRFRSQRVTIDHQSRDTAEAELRVESNVSKQRSIERVMEETRSDQLTSQELVSSVQGELYSLGADIATIERNIEHARETEHQQRNELDRLRDTFDELRKQERDDGEKLSELEVALGNLRESRVEREKKLRLAEQGLTTQETDLDHWQYEWEGFTQRAAEPVQQQEVERNRIVQLDSRDQGLQQRLARLDEEDQGLLEEEELLDLDAVGAEVTEGERSVIDFGQKIQKAVMSIDVSRQAVEGVREQLDGERQHLHEMTGRLESLQELQATALDSDDERYQEWLRARGLTNAPRLAREVRAASGWERAADTILGERLAGLGVENLEIAVSAGQELPGANLFLVESGGIESQSAEDDTLLGRIHSSRYDLRPLLAGVYIAETLEEALSRRQTLKPWECVVTRHGVVIGRNWLRAPTGQSAYGGILARGEEIEQLESERQTLERRIKSLEQQLDAAEKRNHGAIEEQRKLQDESEFSQNNLAKVRQVLASREARATQIRARSDQLRTESDELARELTSIGEQLAEARRNFSLAEDETGSLERNREILLDNRDQLTDALAGARQVVHDRRDQLHATELEIQGLQVSVDSIRSTMERLVSQSKRVEGHQTELEKVLDRGDEPERDYKQKLDDLLKNRQAAEQRLVLARTDYSQKEEILREERAQLSECDQEIAAARDVLEQHRIQAREYSVRFETLVDQIKSGNFSIDSILENLVEDANEPEWEGKTEQLAEKIRQIGPVNLVAIDEFDEQSKRKEYLDGQHNDLNEALGTLEGVMKKIDRETRERFRGTFDLLNHGFREFFPQLFGGGSAVLELTEDDLLKAGVTVMARPPGKRNSTIHLLSGGEKALTAVALLFALFRLNPAPFCILDEVDAPLDDANVERYCSTLRSLSERTQLIVITHNKITMESADILLGVTMGEPGVSAIVSVDIEQAVGMAAG